jgi:FAD/FMN-containing dehydrogenase
VVIDLTHLNATEYNPETKVASVGTGARWGEVYAELQEHEVGVTGGRQSPVGVGGLTLGGGVGWTTPRTGFGCDSVVNYEVVLANGEIVNANASCHADLWRALKGGSSNFGMVTKFDIDTFPARNITLERRAIGPKHTDEYIDTVVDYCNLDQSYDENAVVSVISYFPGAGITMTVTEVNTANNASTTAFEKFNRMPVMATTGKNSHTLPDVAVIDAPELAKSHDAE